MKSTLHKLIELRDHSNATEHTRASPSSIVTLILGGGQGTRLFPLTQSRCKPALCFGGRYRLIDVPISNSLNAGLNKIFVLTQFLARSLHKHIFHSYRQDAFFPGFIEVLSAEQRPGKSDWFQGTADAVRQNIEYLLETTAEFFLILSGDQLYRLDFDALMKCTEQRDVDVWVATLAVSEKEASRMGVMKVNEDRQIIDFYEKPQSPDILERMRTPPSVLRSMGLERDHAPNFLASMGIYLFRRKALFDLLAADPRDDFGKHLIPTQVKKGGIAAFIHEGYWEDIGTIESFYKANLALNQDNPPFSCHWGTQALLSTAMHLPGSRFGNGHISASTICEGSVVDADEISNSILGQRTIVRRGTIVRDSYLMGNDRYPHSQATRASPGIGEDCIIRKAIIDKDVTIGNRVHLVNKNNLLNFDGDPIFVRDGIIVVARGATIPDDFTF